MASSLLNKLKLIAGESIDTIDPTDPNDSNQAIIDRYKNVPGVNLEKLTEYVNLNIPEPQTIVDAIILAEAIGYTPEQAKVVGAQWALESGRGVSTAGADYNYFGVKSHNDAVMKRMSEQYGIDVTEGAIVNTGENAADGSSYTENVTFASFKNPIEGFLGKKAFLETNERYKKALNPENTADEFAQGLKDAGYATDPVYASKLANIYNGPMRTTRPEWMAPTRKSNVSQKEWTMTGVQPTEGSRADLVKEKIQSSVPEKIDLQSAEEMQTSINIDALQEWNNLQKQNWAGVKEWDPKGVEMLKEYNKKMGVNYDPSEAWSGITISNAVMAASGANNRDEIRAKGFNPSKGHSYYISDAFKTSKNPDYKYNKYKAEKLSGTYNIGDILVKGRKPKKGIDTSKWSYEDFKSHGPGYASHTDIIVDKGTDDKGEYIEIAGGNVGDTYATERIYVKDIPSRKYKATLRDRANIKPSFTINKEELVLNPFTGEKESSGDAILNDITYNPKMPRMIGYTDDSVSNYLKGTKNYEDVVLAQLAAEEEKNYQSSADNYEKLAAENAANEEIIPKIQMLPKVQVAAKKRDNTEDEIIPLQKPVEQEQEKVIDMEYLNSIPDVNSFISPRSFTNESRSKEQLKQDAEAEQFIMSPLKKNANSGYFGSGQSIFYPSTRQQKYGGGMSRKYFENGGSEDEISKPTNPINTSKGLFGMLGDAAKYSAARKMSKTELPEQGNLSYDEYLGNLNRKQLASIPFKEQIAKRDVEAENYHVNQVKDNMLKIASDLEGMDMKEDYEYLGVPWMGQQNIKQIGDGLNEDVTIVDDTSSWFHKIPSPYYTGYQNEKKENVLSPYTCIGAYCAIGAKAGARMTEDNKYGKAGDPWKVITGNYIVDDPKIEKSMGLYPKNAEDMEPGDVVRQGYHSNTGTGHTMLITGDVIEEGYDQGKYPTTYGSAWDRGVFSDTWARIDDAKGIENPNRADQILGYEGRLPAMKENLTGAQSLNSKYQNYLDQKAIAKMPIKEAKLIRTGPTKMPFIERKQYPNTRKGRKQEQQDNAYITAYMNRMQKK